MQHTLVASMNAQDNSVDFYQFNFRVILKFQILILRISISNHRIKLTRVSTPVQVNIKKNFQ
jgi:hypothetical protein